MALLPKGARPSTEGGPCDACSSYGRLGFCVRDTAMLPLLCCAF